MTVNIRGSGILPTEALRRYVERRLNFALGRFPQVVRATVRLGDLNGPRGGIDKWCRIALSLCRRNGMVIEDVDHDLYVAIDRATDRAGRAVARAHRRGRADWQSVPSREEAALGALS